MRAGVHHVLLYDYVPDILERRGPYRDAHLARLAELAEAGKGVGAGAVGEPPYGAAIIFRVEDDDEIARYIDGDPYVEAGLVTGWRIVPWNVAITA